MRKWLSIKPAIHCRLLTSAFFERKRKGCAGMGYGKPQMDQWRSSFCFVSKLCKEKTSLITCHHRAQKMVLVSPNSAVKHIHNVRRRLYGFSAVQVTGSACYQLPSKFALTSKKSNRSARCPRSPCCAGHGGSEDAVDLPCVCFQGHVLLPGASPLRRLQHGEPRRPRP